MPGKRKLSEAEESGSPRSAKSRRVRSQSVEPGSQVVDIPDDDELEGSGAVAGAGGAGPDGRRDSGAGQGSSGKKLLDKSLSTEKRQEIRRRYRELEEETNNMRAEIIDPTTDTYGKFLERQDELHQYASFTSELSPDSRQTKLMSDLLLEQTQKVAELSKWKHPQLHKAVKRHFSLEAEGEGEDVNWAAIGHLAAAFCRSVPIVPFMNGPMSLEVKKPKERKKAERRKREENVGPAKKPKELKHGDEGEVAAGMTDDRVEKLKELLARLTDNGKRPIPFFPFVINPFSYSETIENMFDCDFLVKEGLATLYLDRKTDVHMIATAELPTGEGATHQALLKLDYQMWLDLIELFEIRKPTIPPRAKPAAAAHASPARRARAASSKQATLSQFVSPSKRMASKVKKEEEEEEELAAAATEDSDDE